MSSNLPGTPSNASAWQDGDPFSTMNRQTSNATNPSSRPLSGITNQNKPRNGYISNGEKAVPVPTSSAFFSNGPDRNGRVPSGVQSFELARSPPNPNPVNKNTKHVPCKFFRQGACQAGNACPFSHSLDPMTQQAPCKYFMKGNCKFGAKCALAHYLPDGRRVNRADLDAGMGIAHRSFGYNARADAGNYPNTESGLTDPMISQQQFGADYFPSGGFPLIDPDEDAFQDRYNQYQNPSQLDSALNSPPTSQFGSPPSEYLFPKSPVDNIRTALNAPLPQSFDANGISHIAKYGPLGQSVPDKFGFRSPPSSSLSRQLGSPPDSTSNFRATNLTSNLRNASPLGISPQNVEESIGQRIMHSQRPSKSRVISASVPRSHLPHDWEEGLGTETDLLPNSLHDEVLTPQEKMRRLSRPDQDLSPRDQQGGLAIPSSGSSKVGSPPTAGSPSRFSALWAEQREKKAAETGSPNAFGHVGSPLRESWLAGHPSETSKGPQLSGISQAMARMHLNRTESTESNGSKPTASGLRHSSAPIGRFDRTISSPGLSSRKIDEEGEGVFFPMDDEKRTNSLWSGQSPGLAPLPENPSGNSSRNKGNESDLSLDDSVPPIFGFRV